VSLIKDNKENEIDTKFWSSIYHYNDESGGPTITGWINTFFPYLTNSKNGFRKNAFIKFTADQLDNVFSAPSPGSFPPSFCDAPMKWNYLGKKIDCGMLSGIIGYQFKKNQNESCLAPIIAWIIHGK